MSVIKSSTVRRAPGIAAVLAGRERDERGRIPQIWSTKKALEESKKFNSRKSFRINGSGGYQYLVRKKLIYLVSFDSEVKRASLSDFDIICAIKSCKTRTEMSERFNGEYSAVFRRKHLKPLYHEHFGRGKTSKHWDDDKALAESKKYSTRSAFSKCSQGAYSYVMDNDISHEAFSHMERITSDFDSVYIWCAGYLDSGIGVYKIGVTSIRLGTWRIDNVAVKSGFSPHGLIIAKSRSALKAEKNLMKIGKSAGMTGFTGSSEFRLMTNKEYSKAYGVIYEHAD